MRHFGDSIMVMRGCSGRVVANVNGSNNRRIGMSDSSLSGGLAPSLHNR
jgi:hypothetical protein